jgi:ABC-type nitrate/sulfonate/bicarbonate transport system substrate-binding protein
MFTRVEVLERRPAAIRSLLRAHVAALRLARADRELAVRALQRHLRFDRAHAERAYAEDLDSFDERGALPAAAMPVFWRIAVEAGEVDAPWPEARFLDRRFLDSFDQWAPR